MASLFETFAQDGQPRPVGVLPILPPNRSEVKRAASVLSRAAHEPAKKTKAAMNARLRAEQAAGWRL
jgi:hypothetical protein